MVRTFIALIALTAQGILPDGSCRGADAVAAATAVNDELLVTVRTADGRQLSGMVDVRSDDRSLWIRRQEGSIVLAVPVAWDELTNVELAGAEIAAAELKERRAEIASNGPRQLIPEAILPQVATTAGPVPYDARRCRVRSIEIIDAALVNLDRDAEPDGIEVAIAVLDEGGEPMAVRGAIRATLHGERRPLLRPDVEFEELERWSQRVAIDDFHDGVATVVLPFRQTAPEWEFDLIPDASLTVELGAFGHGNFAATAPVVLRRFDRLRDDRQLYRGSRFFQNEIQGWRPQSPFGSQDGLWLPWTPGR